MCSQIPSEPRWTHIPRWWTAGDISAPPVTLWRRKRKGCCGYSAALDKGISIQGLFALNGVINNRFRIALRHSLGRGPRLVQMLDRQIRELRYIALDVVTVGVELLGLARWVEDPKVRRRVGAATGNPLPIELVLRNVAVAQMSHEPLSAMPPPNVQVLDQECCHDHPYPIVHPAL